MDDGSGHDIVQFISTTLSDRGVDAPQSYSTQVSNVDGHLDHSWKFKSMFGHYAEVAVRWIPAKESERFLCFSITATKVFTRPGARKEVLELIADYNAAYLVPFRLGFYKGMVLVVMTIRSEMITVRDFMASFDEAIIFGEFVASCIGTRFLVTEAELFPLQIRRGWLQ